MKKYRVWDSVTEIMYYPEDFKLVIDHGEPELHLQRKLGVVVAKENDIGKSAYLMQSTGLKDKNGVEIYEGDIVKRTHLFNGGYGETHTGEVVYDKDYARYVISRPQKHIEPKTEDLRNTLSDKSTYEVIGNILEEEE